MKNLDQKDEIPKHRSKKNTKKFCKGKEGVLHQPRWVEGQLSVMNYRCIACFKVLATCLHFGGRRCICGKRSQKETK